MARADVMFSIEGMPRTMPHENIPVREDLAFANAAGKEKKRVRNFAEKMLKTLAEPLQKRLKKDEVVLYICRANSPMKTLEQLSFGHYAQLVAGAALVVTNTRMLAFRITYQNNWTKSLREVAWADVRQAKVKGWLTGHLDLEYRNGKKERYWGIAIPDKKKLNLLVEKLAAESQGEAQGVGEMCSRCPECLATLKPGNYECPQCGLVFKQEKQVYWRALVPGLAYVYTGHPFLGIADGLGELTGIILLFLGIVGVVTGDKDGPLFLGIGTFIFGFDYLICITHNLRFVREFLATKEHRAEVGMVATGR